MRRRKLFAGLAALAGFVGCVVLSAAALRSSCCSASCEPCPMVLCKSTPANSAPKQDVFHALLPSSSPLLRHVQAASLTISHARILPFLSHEFVRPMRN